MAITFTTPIPTDRFILSEENRVVTFSTDSGVQSVYCDINIGTEASLRVYPLPDGTFWVNLVEFLSPLLRNYDDNIDPTTIDPTDIDTFVFDWSRVFLNSSIDFTLRLITDVEETASFTPYVLLGSEQIKDYKKGFTVSGNSSFVLSPLKKDTANTFHMRYWEGYPFDFCLSRNIPTLTNPQQITNLTNGITSPDIATPYSVNRIFISDGDTNTTIEDYLPLASGYNKLSLNNNIFIELWKHASECGVYFKWLNVLGGGWNYWLFNSYEKIQKNISNRGVINNDFYNIEDTVSQFKSLGKTAVDTYTVLADFITNDDVDLLKGILISPKVYLFTGTRFSRNTFNDWIEIQINNRQQIIKNAKEKNNEFLIEFTMPEDYTITL